MSDDERSEQLYQEIHARATAVEPNAVIPGEPTTVGWLRVLVEEVVDLRRRIEARPQLVSQV